MAASSLHMAGFDTTPISGVLRKGLFVVLGLVCAAAYFLTIQLTSRLYAQSGRNQLQNGEYAGAIARLDKAERWMRWNGGGFVFRDDLRRVHIYRGQAAQQLALSVHERKPETRLAQAVNDYRQALAIHSRDIDAVRGMAFSLAARDTLAANDNDIAAPPEHPRPYFEALARIRPNSVSAHYSLAVYNHSQGMDESIPEIVAHILSIYPAAYWRLARESFYSDKLLPFVQEGLDRALERGVNPREAHFLLARILEQNGQNAEAVPHYRNFLAIAPSLNRPDDYIHLGRLHLRKNDPENAGTAFMQAIAMELDRDALLRRIYRMYEHSERLHNFIEFADALVLDGRATSNPVLWKARAWLGLGNTDMARRTIGDLAEQAPSAEVFALLSEIAAKEEDWDAMELAAQRAVIIDDADERHWRALIRALRRQGKHVQAEQAAARAIARSPHPNPWLFNLRAWQRWVLGLHESALEDWRRAAAILPEHADFHYRIARVYEHRKDWLQARYYLRRALSLDPDNIHYRRMWNRTPGANEEGDLSP